MEDISENRLNYLKELVKNDSLTLEEEEMAYEEIIFLTLPEIYEKPEISKENCRHFEQHRFGNVYPTTEVWEDESFGKKITYCLACYCDEEEKLEEICRTKVNNMFRKVKSARFD